MRRSVLLAVLASVGFSLAGCGAEEESARGERATGALERLPAAPLGPRETALGVWTGHETLVMGGSDAPPCPPTADCVAPAEPPLRDGAAFDPARRVWRRIADAPVAFSDAVGAVVRDVVYVLAPGMSGRPGAPPAFLAYRPAEDRWERLPFPPGEAYRALTAAGARVVAHSTSDEYGAEPDLVFDPRTGRWSELPDDPLPPSFDRSMAWAGGLLVLFGKEIVSNPGSEEPALALAAALDLETGRWRRLPDSETLDAYAGQVRWFEVGGRLINPAPGYLDGGEVNGWDRPYPHGGVLDPRTGEWSDLPARPEAALDDTAYGAGLVAGEAAHYYDYRGFVLDAEANDWIRIPALPESDDVSGRTVAPAGRSLLVFGGTRWRRDTTRAELLDDAHLWTP